MSFAGVPYSQNTNSAADMSNNLDNIFFQWLEDVKDDLSNHACRANDMLCIMICEKHFIFLDHYQNKLMCTCVSIINNNNLIDFEKEKVRDKWKCELKKMYDPSQKDLHTEVMYRHHVSTKWSKKYKSWKISRIKN